MRRLVNRQAAARLALATVVFVSIASPRGQAGGSFGDFQTFAGDGVPRTAAVFVTMMTPSLINAQQQHVLGWYLDEDGDGHADTSDVAYLSKDLLGISAIWSAMVSPTDPDVVYLFGRPPENSGAPFGERVVVIRRMQPFAWGRIGTPITVPAPLAQNSGRLNTPVLRQFSIDHVTMMAVREVDGRDQVLVVRNQLDYEDSFYGTYAILDDSPEDEDKLADRWQPPVVADRYDPMTLDCRGGVLARHISDVTRPYRGGDDAIVRLVDSDSDGIAEVAGSATRGPDASFVYGTGWGDVDEGSDRGYVVGFADFDLDSRGRPVEGTVRNFERGMPGIVPFVGLQPTIGIDGRLFATCIDQLFRGVGNDYAVASWSDLDHDGRSDNFSEADPIEIEIFTHDSDFYVPIDFPPSVVTVSTSDPELVGSDGRGGSIVFRDFGTYSDQTAFRYRFGSADWESLWIGPNGIVSVTGPVTGPATPENLAANPGAIAAFWSDTWDTSEVRVHAGPAPKVRSWRTGEVVKGFAVEWRGLRAPGWEPGRRAAMRLLLYEDGTYRTDFGAMEAEEIGEMDLVTGWSGPGAHPVTLEVDASTHAWGGSPAGSGAERVAYEAFNASKRSDVGHLWVRWNGYPERQDAPGPVPAISSAVRQNGKLTISGVDIAAGATVVVDVADRFALKKKGSSWLVKKKTRSTGTNRTVTEIWSDGAPHTVFVVNPDGTPSVTVVVE